jgi:hypothetical protein
VAIPTQYGSFTESVRSAYSDASLNVTKPSAGVTGDIYVIVTIAYVLAASPGASTCPGFTLLGSVNSASTDGWGNWHTTTVLAKKHDGTEGSAFAVTPGASANYFTVACYKVQDLDLSGTILQALDGSVATASSSTGSINLPSVTTTQANSGAFAVVGSAYSDLGTISTWTYLYGADADFLNSYSKGMAVAGSTGTDSASTTAGTNEELTAIVWAFKEDGGSAPANISGTGSRSKITSAIGALSVTSPITDYIIEYRLTSGPGPWTQFVDTVTPTTGATITGLSPNTNYDFRISAVNPFGRGLWSNIVTVTSGGTGVVKLHLGDIQLLGLKFGDKTVSKAYLGDIQVIS